MKTNITPKHYHVERNTPRRLMVWIVVITGILLLPFITNAPWGSEDYFFAGFVLLSAVTIYELGARRIPNRLNRYGFGIAILLVIMGIWALAVSGV